MALKDIIKQINSLPLTNDEKEEAIQNARSIIMNPRLRRKCFYKKDFPGVNAFVWRKTPQGHDYWGRIHDLHKTVLYARDKGFRLSISGRKPYTSLSMHRI